MGAPHYGRAVRSSRTNFRVNMHEIVLKENLFEQFEYALSVFVAFTIQLDASMKIACTTYGAGVHGT